MKNAALATFKGVFHGKSSFIYLILFIGRNISTDCVTKHNLKGKKQYGHKYTEKG